MERRSLPSPPLTHGHLQDVMVLRTNDAASTMDYTLSKPISPPSSISSRPANDADGNKPSRDNCNRRRPDEEDDFRLPNMSQQILGRAVTPFLREHIPGLYAPIGKPDLPSMLSVKKNPNSKFCYRHRPDSKCRRAADESKMSLIQNELSRLPQADQQAITHVWSLFSAAPSKHRELMLKGIITQCCFPQLSIVSREVSEQLKIDFISALPTELSFRILSFLDCASLCKAAQVSRRWHDLADDNVVWHHLCQQHIDRKCKSCGWALPKMETKALKDWRMKQQLAIQDKPNQVVHVHHHVADNGSTSVSAAAKSSGQKRGSSEVEDSDRAKRQHLEEDHDCHKQMPVRPLSRPWKDIYRDRHEVGRNWKYGRCSVQVFKNEHTNGVTALQFDDNILATGSYDSTIKIWDIARGKVIRTLQGHASGVRALQLDDRKLVSGSLDGTVKIWNWRTGECLNTLNHQAGVITVHFSGDLLASGSMDRSIKIFNFKTQQSFCLRGHEDWVNQVKIDTISRTVFSASDDCTVKLWDLDSRTCLKTYSGHVGQVQQVLPLPDDFEFEDENNPDVDVASVTSNRSGTPGLGSSSPAPLDEERQAYGSAFEDDTTRQLPPRYMLTGSLDATMRLWDTATGNCLKTFFGHVEGIWGLVGDSLRYVTGANDATVKIWSKNGACERTFAGHEGPVTCVGLSDSRMASGGEDGEVRLYRFDTDTAEAEELGTPA